MQVQDTHKTGSETFTVRVDVATKRRLEKLAESTGRSRSFLAVEAIDEYLNIHEWQVAGIRQAIASMNQGEGVVHEDVRQWVELWNTPSEAARP